MAKLKPNVSAVAEELLRTYADESCTHISYSSRQRLPDQQTVIVITDGLFPILYAGYLSMRPNSERFLFYLRRQLSSLREQLAEQITLALKFEHSAYHPCENYRVWGEESADALIAELPELRTILDQDVQAAFQGDPAAKNHHEVVVNYPGVCAITVYRLAHILEELSVPLIPRMMSEYAHSKTGIDIHPGAKIGPAFFIDHGTGVVIGETTVIGRQVTLYQGVTLGAINFDRDEGGQLIRNGKKRHPTLEDNVVVYANASILGGDTVIGRNSTVGANVWLVKSLPPEHIAKLEKRKLRIEPRQKNQVESQVDRERREMRIALSEFANDGNPHCGDIDEMEW